MTPTSLIKAQTSFPEIDKRHQRLDHGGGTAITAAAWLRAFRWAEPPR